MTDHDNYVAEVERQIDVRNANLIKFRVIAEVAAPDDQIEYYQIIKDIVDKENAVKEKLAAFCESDEAGRNYLKTEINYLQKRVEDAIEAARHRIN